MIRKYLILSSAIAITATATAQKDELKSAEKALKNKNAVEALTVLKNAESVFANATPEEKAQYFFTKAKAHLDLAYLNVEKAKNFRESAIAFNEVEKIEKESGKNKFSKQIGTSKAEAINGVRKIGYEDYVAKNYKETAKAYTFIFEMDNAETDYLYDAANASIMGNDYDTALKNLEKLRDLNYTGEGIYYKAKNKLNDKVEYFGSKKDRDDAIKLGTYGEPSEEVKPSKRGEIYKNIALIYVQQNKVDEAKKALQDARKVNPNDVSIATAEAEVYMKLKDFDKYTQIINEILQKDPNNKDLIFNLGVISYNGKDYANAEKHYQKVIQLDPNYVKAHYNMGVLKIDVSQDILDEMNKLGMSKADGIKYDKLKDKRDGVLKEVITYFEKTLQLTPDNEDAKVALVSVYNALDMTDKAKALKATIK